MDTEFHGMKIDRYDDIWSGLFTSKLIHNRGENMTFGLPVSAHRRNKHDYVSDLKGELWAMTLNDQVWKTVMDLDIRSRNYVDGYIELLDKFRNEIKRTVTDGEVLAYFDKVNRAEKVSV